MLLIFIAMLPISLTVAIFLLVGLPFLVLHIKKALFKEINFYISVFLSFLVPGLGIAYIGFPLKGFGWYMTQFLFVAIAFIVSQLINISDKYLGMIIMIPFFIQLYVTGIEYKNKFGDIRI